MIWEKADLSRAVRWMEGRTVSTHLDGCSYAGLPSSVNRRAASGILFEDGTVVFSESICRGPYSDVTPDLDIDPPTFWLGEPDGPVEIVGTVDCAYIRDPVDHRAILGFTLVSRDDRPLRVEFFARRTGEVIGEIVVPPGEDITWQLHEGVWFREDQTPVSRRCLLLPPDQSSPGNPGNA